MHTFFIENLGCSKNQVDAEEMIARLSFGNWRHLDTPNGADVIVINTCGFVESARAESIEVALEFRSAHPHAKIVMSGCMAQRYSQELMDSMPEVDAFFGNKDLSHIERVLERVIRNERFSLVPQAQGGVETSKTATAQDRLAPSKQAAPAVPAVRRSTFFSFPRSAYVKLSEGCNHNCSYCAIPLIRGPLQSRSFEAVMQEIQQLLQDGIFEINLIAQDLASFGTDRALADISGRTECNARTERTASEASQFVQLLEAISALPGDFWVRLLYIHPDNFPWDIIPIMQKDSRILPYFDIPIQHVSQTILAPMGRTGHGETYAKLVADIRKTLPQAAIRTTFLLGFPGETAETLKELETYVERIGFDWAGFFIYSPEEGTKSVNSTTKQERQASIALAAEALPHVQELQMAITTERMAARVGQEVSVLVEEPIEGEDLSFGRTPFQAPEVDGCTVLLQGKLEAGKVVRVKLVASSGPDMSGEVL